MKAAGALVLLLGAAFAIEQRLRADAAPAPVANRLGMGRLLGSVVTGPFRPLLQSYLWIRADILYGQGRFDETAVLFRTMVKLYPHNRAAREFTGWHLAFNLKNEAPNADAAWIWSRDGLDILAEADASRTLADWFLKQCGQNPVEWARYAGPGWEQEKAIRALAAEWGVPHFGRRLPRYDLGLAALGDRTKFFDQLRRVSLLTYGLYDDLVRTGRTTKTREAIELAKWMSTQLHVEGLPPPTGWREEFEERAWIFSQLEKRHITRRLIGLGDYRVAMALFGMGARQQDDKLLAAAYVALLAFDKLRESDAATADEQDLVRRWRAYVKDPALPRPPHPFD